MRNAWPNAAGSGGVLARVAVVRDPDSPGELASRLDEGQGFGFAEVTQGLAPCAAEDRPAQTGGGVFLLAVVIGGLAPALHRRRPRFHTNPWLTAALVLSSAAILFLGVYGVLNTLELTPDS